MTAAERKAGKMIPKMFLYGGDRKSEDKKSSLDSLSLILEDYGISLYQSSIWQKGRAIDLIFGGGVNIKIISRKWLLNLKVILKKQQQIG